MMTQASLDFTAQSRNIIRDSQGPPDDVDRPRAPVVRENVAQRPPPAQEHSATSKAAARSIEPASGTLRREVLDYLRRSGPLGGTDEECQLALAMPPSTQRPRRIELVESGHVIDSGKTRKTRSGRSAVVWCVRK